MSHIEGEHTEAKQHLVQTKTIIESYDIQIEELKAQLAEQSTQLGSQVKKTQSLELERNKAKGQLAALKKMAANFEWYRDGVKGCNEGATL